MKEIIKFKDQALQKVEAMPFVSDLPDRREIKFEYRYETFPAKVSCIAEQISIELEAFLRGKAIAKKLLEGFGCEHELFEMTPAGNLENTIDPD
eukprot:4328496-Lingulodinium_polyedra.AAC.1